MTWKTQLLLAKSLSCSLSPGIQVRDTGADGSCKVSLYGPVTVTLWTCHSHFVCICQPSGRNSQRSIFTMRRDLLAISFVRADQKLKETKGNTYFRGSSCPRHLELGHESECAYSPLCWVQRRSGQIKGGAQHVSVREGGCALPAALCHPVWRWGTWPMEMNSRSFCQWCRLCSAVEPLDFIYLNACCFPHHLLAQLRWLQNSEV